MSRNIVHEGGPDDVMPWTNVSGSDVAAGAVVKALHTIGIALVAIPAGETGSIAIGGVISGVAKTTGTAWAQGAKLFWDISASKFDYYTTAPATGDVTGCAIVWLTAASGDTTGSIKLTPGNNSIGVDQVANLNTWATALATKLNADAGVTDTNYDTDPQS